MPRTRILVVDDDPMFSHLLQRTLLEEGFEVETAVDGQDALEKVKARMPDLIVTDVVMPRMDGWAFIKQFRTLSGSSFVPVIFLTARASTQDRVYGFRLGADDYLPKPFDSEELVLRVNRAIDRRRGIEQSTRSISTASKSSAVAALQGTLAELGLASLLTILEMERKSGVLEVSNALRRENAALILRDGRIVQASLDAAPPKKGHETIYHLAEWSDGRFLFTSMPVEVPDEMKTATSSLLLEAARRLDESRRQEASA